MRARHVVPNCVPDLVRALHDRIEFSEKFMAYLLARNVRVEADLVDQKFNSSEKRLARVLLLLANFARKVGLNQCWQT